MIPLFGNMPYFFIRPPMSALHVKVQVLLPSVPPDSI